MMGLGGAGLVIGTIASGGVGAIVGGLAGGYFGHKVGKKGEEGTKQRI
jgi:hypothetical protein